MKKQILEALGHRADSVELKNLIAVVSGAPPVREDAPESKKYYLQFYPEGLSLLFDEDGFLSSVFCYFISDEGFDEYAADTEELCGLSRGDDSKKVIAKLGEADLHKFSSVSSYNFKIPERARYDMEKYSLYISFSDEKKSIAYISYIRRDTVPR
jgi:hypothetical protein